MGRSLRPAAPWAAAALVLAIAAPAALAGPLHRRVLVPVTPVYPAQAPTAYVAQAPTSYVAQAPTSYVAQAPTTYVAQAPTPNVAQAPINYVVQVGSAPAAGSAPAVGAAPDDTSGTRTISVTSRAAIIRELREGYKTGGDTTMADRVTALRESAETAYAALLGIDRENLGPAAKDDVNSIIDEVIGFNYHRPPNAAAYPPGYSPYYTTSGVTAAAPIPYAAPVPVAAAAPSLYLVQPVVPVPLMAPVPRYHPHPFHPFR